MLHYAEFLPTFVAKAFAGLLLPLYSTFSIASLFSALCVAIGFVLLNRRPDKRSIRYRVMLRALFPSWLYRNASFRADVGFLLLNVLLFGALFGWAMFSANSVSNSVRAALTASFGAVAGDGFNGVAGATIAAVSAFLAYEVAYWLDHYLKHRVPLLWEFHKVHHTAEVLSPLTNFRVHPLDTFMFGNIVALFMGTTHGVMSYLKFMTTADASVSAIVVAFMWVLGHLHHSHLWISFRGPLGHLILSPAHHQIHHSDNPIHFNKNFGAFLSIWDWLFGTLHMPERRRERLSFGVGHRAAHEHTAVGSLVTPLVLAWRHIRPLSNNRA